MSGLLLPPTRRSGASNHTTDKVLSSLMISQIILDLLTEKAKEDVWHYGIAGVHLSDLEAWSVKQDDATWLATEVFVCLFCMLYGTAGMYLATATFKRNPRYALMWIIVDACGTIIQCVGLGLRKQVYGLSDVNEAYPICNIIFCILMWVLVTYTRWSWVPEREDSESIVSYYQDEESATTPLLGSTTYGTGEHESMGHQKTPLFSTREVVAEIHVVPRESSGAMLEPADTSASTSQLTDQPLSSQSSISKLDPSQVTEQSVVNPKISPANHIQVCSTQESEQQHSDIVEH